MITELVSPPNQYILVDTEVWDFLNWDPRFTGDSNPGLEAWLACSTGQSTTTYTTVAGPHCWSLVRIYWHIFTITSILILCVGFGVFEIALSRILFAGGSRQIVNSKTENDSQLSSCCVSHTTANSVHQSIKHILQWSFEFVVSVCVPKIIYIIQKVCLSIKLTQGVMDGLWVWCAICTPAGMISAPAG